MNKPTQLEMALGKEAFDKLCNAIDNAKAPNEAMKKAAKGI